MWFSLKTDYTQYMALFIDGQGHLWWRLEDVLQHLEPMQLFDTLPYQRIRDILPSTYHRDYTYTELMEKMMSDRDVLALFRDFNEMLHWSLLQLFQEGKVKETRSGWSILEQCHHMGERFKDVLESYKARAIQRYNRSPVVRYQREENAQDTPLEEDSGIEDESPSEEEDSSIENQESSSEEEIESEEPETMDPVVDDTTITTVNGNIHINIYLHKQKQPCKAAATSTC